MAQPKWEKSKKFSGVRWYAHPTRRNGVRFDRCFGIRYAVAGKRFEAVLGWESGGWTEEAAHLKRLELIENAKQGSGPVTPKRENAAKRAAAEVLRLEQEAQKAAQAQEAVTFGSIFDAHYLPHTLANKKRNSYVTERGLYQKWIAPVIAGKPLKTVSPFDVERIKRAMADGGVGPRTVYYAVCVVRQVFNFARDHGLTECLSPTAKTKKPKFDNRRLRFLTSEEADRLLAALKAKSQEVYEVVLLSLRTGARASEVFRLTWADVDMERGLLTLLNTKNGRTRVAFLTGDAKDMLEAKSRGDKSALVFPSKKGKQIVAISTTFDRVVKALGLNDDVADTRQRVVFHSLRHTYASQLVAAGVDLYVVKELMGHEMIQMTERYSHVGDNQRHAAVRALEKSLGVDNANKKVARILRARVGGAA